MVGAAGRAVVATLLAGCVVVLRLSCPLVCVLCKVAVVCSVSASGGGLRQLAMSGMWQV